MRGRARHRQTHRQQEKARYGEKSDEWTDATSRAVASRKSESVRARRLSVGCRRVAKSRCSRDVGIECSASPTSPSNRRSFFAYATHSSLRIKYAIGRTAGGAKAKR